MFTKRVKIIRTTIVTTNTQTYLNVLEWSVWGPQTVVITEVIVLHGCLGVMDSCLGVKNRCLGDLSNNVHGMEAYDKENGENELYGQPG